MSRKYSHGDSGELEVRKFNKFASNRTERKQERIVKRFGNNFAPKGTKRDQRVVCYSCGKSGHISKDPGGPAKGKKCNRCQVIGHFEKTCRKRPSKFTEHVTSKQVREITHEPPTFATENEPSENNNEQKVYYTFHTGNLTNLVECKIGGITTEMLIDSGSDANLITVGTWEMMKSRGITVQRCRKGSDKVLRAYGSDSPLDILGSFIAMIDLAKRSVSAEFFVVEKGQRNILGDVTSKQLGVLKIGIDANEVHEEPVAASARIPIPLENAVNKKLDELLERDIIEPKKGPATWVSPLVVARKSNGEIRLCVDLRRVNRAVISKRHPMPVIEDVLAKIGRGNIWSTLDIKDAFFSLELDEESRSVTTFISHRGLYQFKRLPFGLVSAPEIFQRTMDEILVDCEGTYWYLDDVGVEGSTLDEHDERLTKV
ncbi:uncharacterized protein K02A2.6-like [Wyeomyia smithii]|uniref:uncharacterized protein K02A2.6-like n=1 Tax=Wyeomyia smithii TaxID=174621 RepID=UPI002467AE2A|nr:uncharacterized protein K02A2.6-like [Wyeomyia smithii]